MAQHRPYKPLLALRLTIYTMAVLTVTIAIIGSVFYFWSQQNIEDNIHRSLTIAGNIIRNEINAYTYDELRNTDTFNTLLTSLKEKVKVHRIIIINSNHSVIADSDNFLTPGDDYLNAMQDAYEIEQAEQGSFMATKLYSVSGSFFMGMYIPYSTRYGHNTGSIYISTGVEYLTRLRRTLRSMSIMILISLFAVGIIIYIVIQWLLIPTRRLMHAMIELRTGNMNIELTPSTNDEVGWLTAEFTTMAKAIREKLALQQRLASIGEIAVGVAHEVRNGLSPIMTAASSMRRHYPDNSMLESIIVEVRELDSFIQNFLAYARPHTPDLSKTIELADFLSKAAQRLSAHPVFKSKHITLSMNISPAEIPGDDTQLQHVFDNLLINAAEAIPDTGTISIITELHHAFVTIIVRDTGQGMTEEELKNALRPFYTAKKGGTGLGLSIAEKIISEHGGDVSVKSSPGKGCSIIIQLPRGEL